MPNPAAAPPSMKNTPDHVSNFSEKAVAPTAEPKIRAANAGSQQQLVASKKATTLAEIEANALIFIDLSFF